MDINTKQTIIAGVKVDILTSTELHQWFEDIFKNAKDAKHLATTYSEFIVAAQKDLEFKKILNQTEINTADGVGILWAASYLNRSYQNKLTAFFGFFLSLAQIMLASNEIKNIIPEKISGSDLIWDIAALCEKHRQSIFLLGGYGDVSSPLLEKHPNLNIAGRLESSPQESGLVEKINQTNADVLLVAFGPIKQEKWIAQNKEHLNVKLIAGLGGTFDFVIGKRPRAGQLWQKLGLEWLHRLITQPWRLKRIWNAVVVFSIIILKEKLSRQT